MGLLARRKPAIMGTLITPDKIKPGILYVDHREEPSGIPELLADMSLLPIQICQLQTGDFIYENIVVERKEINDFVGSFMPEEGRERGRMFTQYEKMLVFTKRYILVHETLQEYEGNVHPHCALGALARLLVSDISVCFGIPNKESFCYLLLKIIEKDKGIKTIITKKRGTVNVVSI